MQQSYGRDRSALSISLLHQIHCAVISRLRLPDVFPLRELYSYAATSRALKQNDVLSTHMRCSTTASFLATATQAIFIDLRFAICRPQARSALHFAERVSRTCAASYRWLRIISSPHLVIWPS